MRSGARSRRGIPTSRLAHYPDGAFTFDGLDEGVYVVEVEAPEHQPLTSEKIELRRGAGDARLSLVAVRGLVISGTALADDGGVPGVRIELLRSPDAPAPEAAATRFGRLGNSRTISSTTSDAVGRWSFTAAAPGRYVLSARVAGYSQATTEPFDLTGDRRDITLRLGSLASLSGRILGAGEDDFSEAYVLAFAGPGRLKTVKANADGSYLLDDLQPGSYLVRAFSGTMRTFLARELREYYRMRAEGAPPPSDLELGEGEHKTLDVPLQRELVGSLQGTVDWNGSTKANLRVSLRPLEATGDSRGMDSVRRFSAFGGYRGSTRTDRDGEFRFDSVPEGQYEMIVRSSSRTARELARRELFITHDQVQTQHVSVVTGGLTGQVDDPTGGDPAQLSGTLQLFADAEAVPANEQAFARTGVIHRIPVRNGTFSADDIPPGSYLAVLRLLGRQLTSQPIAIGRGIARLRRVAGAPADGDGKGG